MARKNKIEGPIPGAGRPTKYGDGKEYVNVNLKVHPDAADMVREAAKKAVEKFDRNFFKHGPREKKIVYQESDLIRLKNEYREMNFGDAIKADVESNNPGFSIMSFEETSPDPIEITAYLINEKVKL